MFRVLRVSASGYYDWRDREPSRRALANVALVEQIGRAHGGSDATYGMSRLQAELIDRGACVGGATPSVDIPNAETTATAQPSSPKLSVEPGQLQVQLQGWRL